MGDQTAGPTASTIDASALWPNASQSSPIDEASSPAQPARTSHRFEHKLQPYRDRFLIRDSDSRAGLVSAPLTPDMDSTNAWEPDVSSPLGLGVPLPTDLSTLVDRAIASSPAIAAILTTPTIEQQEIVIADGDFDARSFVDARFADTNDPIGSLLTTGDGSTRFRDELLTSAIGVRRRSRSGGGIELAQRGGFQSNNSTFLIPNPQSTTRLELNLTRPLMRDRGRAVNQAKVVLARLSSHAALEQARLEVEAHLVRVAQSYWNLYQARANWHVRQELFQEAKELFERVERRGTVDAAKRVVLRVHVALARRRAALIDWEAQVLDAQSTLRRLTGDAAMTSPEAIELMPVERPSPDESELSVRDATLIALDRRADIDKSLSELHALSVRVGVSKNQLLPRLDLILSGYVAGLDNRQNGFDAFLNQFRDGRPSFAAGFAFELPQGNRIAKARMSRDRLEMSRGLARFQQVTENVITEVEVSRRRIETTAMRARLKTVSVEAAQREVAYLESRLQWLPDPQDSVVELIEDLLAAQDRVGDEQRDLIAAIVEHELARIELTAAMGMLVDLSPAHCSPAHATVIDDATSSSTTSAATFRPIEERSP